MDYWYLISSLPYLRFGEKPSMSSAAFRAACVGWISQDQLPVIEALLENREPPAGDASAWWSREVQLRDAIVRVRAKNRSVDASRFLKPYDGFSVTIEKMVADSFVRPDPLEQEMEIDRVRWMLADELATTESFGFAALLAFTIKLRIAERWAAMDKDVGQEKVGSLIEQAISLENEQEVQS